MDTFTKKLVAKTVAIAMIAFVFAGLLLAAMPLTFSGSSVVTAQDDAMVCQTSLISYSVNGSGASTTHNFTIPAGATGGYVVVEFRGDFEDWSPDWNPANDEFIEVYIEGDYIGRDRGHWDDCSENWTAAMWPISAAQMSGWAADGTISVTVANSQEVDDGCYPDQHRVTLCYTTAPVVCEESLISYSGNGTATIHNFSVPSGATALAYVVVEFRGDFGDWSPDWDGRPNGDEFIEVYMEGDYIGRDQGHWDDCSENWTAAAWALSAAQISGWAADGTISVRVKNSGEVQDFCPRDYDTYNQHRVTLCYTTVAPMTCEQSLISYNGSGANTTHNFSVPRGVGAGYVLVEYRGDFGTWSESWNWTDDEFIEVYMEGDYIGRDHRDVPGHEEELDCDGNWTAAMWPISAAQMGGWAADGMISVMVQNSREVNDFCDYNQHRVTLCYTEPEPPPVGGEAYPVNKISLLAPWIAVVLVLVGGISWYVLRRQKAQS